MWRQKVIVVCDNPSVLRSIVLQARKWIETLEAGDPERAHRILENHPDSAVLVTEHLLRHEDGIPFLRNLRHLYPHVRRCLLACYSDLSLVVEAIHGGLVDSLVHLPLTREQFMAAVLRLPPAPVSSAVYAA